jgi:hypothetical protein
MCRVERQNEGERECVLCVCERETEREEEGGTLTFVLRPLRSRLKKRIFFASNLK